MICCLFVVPLIKDKSNTNLQSQCVEVHINYNSQQWPQSGLAKSTFMHPLVFFVNRFVFVFSLFFIFFYIFFLIFKYKLRKIYALFMIARHVIRMLIDKYLEIY